MTGESKCPFASLTRRNFFKFAGGAGLLASGAGIGALATRAPAGSGLVEDKNAALRFYGPHQAGIVTPQQTHTYFATFDLTADKQSDVAALLKRWTDAAAALTQGKTVPGDGGDSDGLGPARLTLTFGFGPGLFAKDGKDRYGLATRRPTALVDLPRFNGDQMIAEKTGGDLSVQACADDPQVAFHAIRQLTRLAADTATLRWVQTGFASGNGHETPRNLQGFKDGTRNPQSVEMDPFVWSGNEGPAWMQGGSYLVARRIRIALEHWDNSNVAFQEQVIGRHKLSGAPLGGTGEFEPPNFDATDKDGNPVIPDNAHIRLAAHENNDNVKILRRGYSYNDGVNLVAERWPPWHQGMEYDAGLLFIAYQRDPRTGFIRMFDRMSKLDALGQFTTHNGGGIFACPGGVSEGEFIGQRLFGSA